MISTATLSTITSALQSVLDAGAATSQPVLVGAPSVAEIKSALADLNAPANGVQATGDGAKAFLQGTPPLSVDIAWLLMESSSELGVSNYVVLGVRSDKGWCVAHGWAGDSHCGNVGEDGSFIVGWQIYTIPAPRLS